MKGFYFFYFIYKRFPYSQTVPNCVGDGDPQSQNENDQPQAETQCSLHVRDVKTTFLRVNYKATNSFLILHRQSNAVPLHIDLSCNDPALCFREI